ncbi:LysR family transcriptional regulator [Oceanimonas sp. GK1]|uniref:LysR substrate-binding domain-containing protein n=1 Tax=Oceanimonas sp. (strain GK1 / IBRC-M 10197) TaxID=511062 RepID=UPI0002494AD5|nr:LysR substrate-binding domain-containing protein [Oceanimonas sp. GK1]AEX99780.1 LysR family transcriptional regulator [Oceanimonas sp. GK1]
MEQPSHRLPKLSNIMAFETAAKTGSLAGAADILCLTPAAVSQQIRQLEDHLGVKLFLRSKHGVELTEAGTSYLTFTQEAFESLRVGQQSLARYQGEQVLTITALPTLASRWLMPRLHQWMARHPHIQLRVQGTHSQIDFGNDPTDFYLSFGDEHYSSQHCVELFRDRVMAVCSPALLPNGKVIDSFEWIGSHAMIHVDWGRDGRFLPDWSEWLQAAGHTASPARPGPSFNLSSMAIDAALAGCGLLLGQRAFIRDELSDGRLVALSDVTLPLNKAYYLVYPERVMGKPGARELVNWLREQANNEE